MKSVKSFLITAYLSIGLLYAIYQNFFGKLHYKSFAYHIGKGLVWPASMFPSFGKAVGGIVLVAIILGLTIRD